VAVQPPDRGHRDVPEDEVRPVPEILQANLTAFEAGWSFGETTEDFAVSYEIKPAQLPTGTYRNISGNLALSYGLIAASQRTGLPLFLGSYPITPASDILHELSKHKRFGVRTFQAEDEIAAVGAALGAAYGGSLAVTSTSGPGLALKAETIGLGVSLELPLIVVDVQRAGPSTGMPTKTEQADLLQAMFGRNGEAPVPIVAPRSPADCFETAIEAARIATTYRVPVILLSDGYLANGSEPWKIPTPRTCRTCGSRSPPRPTPTRTGERSSTPTCVTPRRWPGRGRCPGRQGSSTGSAASRRPTAPATSPTTRPTTTSWCAPGRPRSTRSPRPSRRSRSRTRPATRGCWCSAGDRRTDRSARPAGWCGPPAGRSPRPTCATSTRSRTTSATSCAATSGVLIPEMNLGYGFGGQLAMLVRAKYLVDAIGYHQVRGLPFKAEELAGVITTCIDDIATEDIG
jgi:2-oxoglutarate ferredoxin oxidoreductase subunit alpha